MNNLYEKYVKSLLGKMDSGEFFKGGLQLVFRIAALAIVVYGIITCVISLFGSNGYFSLYKGASGGLIARSVVTFFFTFIISVLTFFAVGIILWYQADDIKENYEGIIFLPSRFLKLAGQGIAIIILGLALINCITALFVGIPFVPIRSLQGFLLNKIFIISGPVSMFSQIGSIGDYFKNLLLKGILGLVSSTIVAFLTVVVYYIFAHIYSILIKFFKNGGNYFKK